MVASPVALALQRAADPAVAAASATHCDCCCCCQPEQLPQQARAVGAGARTRAQTCGRAAAEVQRLTQRLQLAAVASASTSLQQR